MRYWTDRAREIYTQLFQDLDIGDPHEVAKYVRAHVTCAIQAKSPEMTCAIMRFCDEKTDDAPKVRFGTAIRAMALKLYDIAYACWDDEGRSFLYVDDDPEFPTGVQSGVVLRDLCENIMKLQEKVLSQTDNVIEGELCELLEKII